MSPPAKKYNKRKRNRKGKKAKRTKAKLTRAINGFPLTQLCKHRYVSHGYVPAGSSAGLAAAMAYRTNSIFDPDFSNFGRNGQVSGRDDFALIYGFYQVVSSKIKVTFNAAAIPYVACVRTCNQVGSTSDANAIREDPDVKKKNIKTMNANSMPTTITAYFSARKYAVRGTNPIIQAPVAVGSNAAVDYGFVINTMPFNYTEIVAIQYVQVEVEYTVLWSGRNQQAVD